ncbi:TRAP transporter small permease [Oceanidesulfovibrio indonesiensis]|uniref:TRAP transporter small permease n=1 Tax=Oceanidesulfovibrio indonesiensis TaxID=54767 RepID=A0A7M3MHU0_9BACT|nr:TRAP transporter small permease [Oceanidesulfovibrio indonesiensis]TVM19253.1 TRAP transporter small permease [Oceanidesulfovibrio indonesiensis]
MRIVRILTRISDFVNTAAEWALGLLGFSMAAVIGLQVFFRYALNDSLFWSEELGRLILVWLTFLGASVAYKRGAHIGVDALVNALPSAGRRLASIAATCVGLFLFSILAWKGFEFLDFIKFQQTTSLGVSKRVPFLMVPVGGAIMLLHGIAFLARDVFAWEDPAQACTVIQEGEASDEEGRA